MVTLYYGCFPDGAAGSRRLLDRAAQERGARWTLTHDALGKPLIPGGPEISISHTKGAAALAVSDDPVGVDIEQIRSVRPNLPQRVMSPRELRWYQEEGERDEAFFTLWTLKESYYKYLGTGLPGFPNETEFHPEGGIWRLEGSPLRFSVYRADDLVLALCTLEREIRLIRWEES